MERIVDDVEALWVAASDEWIEGDVVRWTEPIFHGRGKKAFGKVGRRRVTAQVLERPESYVDLLVLRCEVIAQTHHGYATSGLLVPRDTKIKRKRKTILDGDGQRLLWRDESARAVVLAETDDASALPETIAC